MIDNNDNKKQNYNKLQTTMISFINHIFNKK